MSDHTGGRSGTTGPAGADRLDGELDAALMLLDRQVLDRDGRMVGKVDDLEIRAGDDGGLVVSAILLGPAALLPRLGGPEGGRVAVLWKAMGRQHSLSGVPGWIDLSAVDHLDSGVHLTVQRDGVIVPQPHDGDGSHRLGDLLGLPVHHQGRRVGVVTDVRLQGGRAERENHARLGAIVVGRGRPGSRLGYDRHPDRGPRLLSLLVHALHRHAGLVAMQDVHIDWDARRVEISREPRPLRST